LDTSNLKITICCFAYRDKSIIETLQNAINLSDNPENIFIFTTIQNSYHYEIPFKKTIGDLHINYFNWHNFDGFVDHRKNMINGIANDSYILFINPGTEFNKSWDTKLINFAKNNPNTVLSINNDIFDLSGAFIQKNILNKIDYPTYLKHYGEQEDISIKLYCSDVLIVAGISKIITPKQLRNWDYVPFSISHQYDQVEKLYKTGSNIYCSINEKYQEYASKYPIKQIFDQLNDPPYKFVDLNLVRTPYEVFNNYTNSI
jgi:hypothetical protein